MFSVFDDAVQERCFDALDGAALLACRPVSAAFRARAEGHGEVWHDAVCFRFPAMAETLGQAASSSSASRGPTDAWFALFLARCRRKHDWAAARQEKKSSKAERLERLKAEAEQASEARNARDGRGAALGARKPHPKKPGPRDASKNRPEPTWTRAVREKTCRRCGARFIPKAPGECLFHSGQYAAEDDLTPSSKKKGVLLLQKKGARVQRVEFGVELGQEAEAIFRWTCCGASSRTAPGCKEAVHC